MNMNIRQTDRFRVHRSPFKVVKTFNYNTFVNREP
jgi:hypothetical protein